MLPNNRNRYLIALLAGILSACAPAMPPQTQGTSTQVPTDFPEARYQHAKSLGIQILRVDTSRSLVTVEVHRAGLLARLGHDHVVASHDVNGYVSVEEGLADLYVPLEQLVVDEPELRNQAGFDTQPSPEDIAGTRRNMLNRTLDAGQFPRALIHVTRATSPSLNPNNPLTVESLVGAGPAREWKGQSHAGRAPTSEESSIGQSQLNVAITLHGVTHS
jgi:hypothetical protein